MLKLNLSTVNIDEMDINVQLIYLEGNFMKKHLKLIATLLMAIMLLI